jgi:triacylglycerol lipase
MGNGPAPSLSISGDTVAERTLPTLLVHGLWGHPAQLDPLRRALEARGLRSVAAIALSPNDGRARIEELGAQIGAEVEKLRHPGAPVDVVGFSMGALASRWYLQRGGGKRHVRRFISISGPHSGTLAAHALGHVGALQMRPNSALLRDLAADLDPWGGVEVHALYTPFDLMIVPAVSSVPPGATTVHRVPALLHRWMLSDARVHTIVANLLSC